MLEQYSLQAYDFAARMKVLRPVAA